jgi:hypothetical protein
VSASAAAIAGSENAVPLYEELRRCVLEEAGACDGDRGRVFLLRGGIVAWMVHRTTRTAPPSPTAEPGRDATAPVLPDEIHAGVVQVLANMALAKRREITA